MSQDLPARPHLDHLRHQAKSLLRGFASGRPEAIARVERAIGPHPILKLADAQRVLAREYGFSSWAKLRTRVEALRGADSAVDAFLAAILDQDRSRAEQTLAAEPGIAAISPAVAAALGRERELRQLLDRDPGVARRLEGAPPAEPLAWLCFSPFHGQGAAQDAGFESCARLLLQLGADPNARASRYQVPILYAVTGMWNVPRIARLLLEAGANPTDGESVFHAAERFHEEALELLLEFGVELNHVGDWGNTPLYFLLLHWNMERYPRTRRGLDWLLEHGADPNIRSGVLQETALHAAVRRGQSAAVVRLLLDHGADARAVRRDGKSVWMLARRSGSPETVALLEQAGAVADPLSAADRLLEACASGNEQEAARLALPALLAEMDTEGQRLIHEAARRGDVPVVRACLSAGYPVNGEDEFAAAPLHHAAIEGRHTVVELLLDAGARLDLRDREHGATPLGWAVFGADHVSAPGADYPATVEALLRSGAVWAETAPLPRHAEVAELLAAGR
ncbi:MAG: ankyrin repeat domain-containing protein [Gemmatimonadales bacterium]